MVRKLEIQIFLAHAKEDKEVVLKLYEHLKKAGYKPWIDEHDLIAGQNWRSVIPKEIEKSQLFIACLSKLSIAKEGYLQDEFKMAFNKFASMQHNSIYFIPLRLDECEIPDLRQDEYGLNIKDIQWIDYWKTDGFAKLEKAISVKYDGALTNDEFHDFTEDFGGDELDMIAIPGGTFMMGSLVDEGYDNEKPQHEVTVKSFYMGKYPITQAQYQRIMGNPSAFKDSKRPVERVSWEEAVEFCQILSEKSEKSYRLPSEAEWEYACRAGTETAFHFGPEITPKSARYRVNLTKSIVELGKKTRDVGYYKPNRFGLYDMHGNVWEWCQDDWHKNYQNAPKDGSAWLLKKSMTKVRRGGSWKDDPDDCRSASRDSHKSYLRYNLIGFRVVCEAPKTT